MKAKLIGLRSSMPRLQIDLDELPAIIGRSPTADVSVDDRWTSRIHCEISEISGTLVVRDLESSNGTLVNGQHVTEAHLLPGDRLTIGLNSYQVQYRRSSKSAVQWFREADPQYVGG